MFKRSNVRTTDHLFGHVTGYNIELIKKLFLDDLAVVKEDESVEILVHPGYFDSEILNYSTLGYERTRDLVLSLDDDFRVQIENLGFKIISYSKL